MPHDHVHCPAGRLHSEFLRPPFLTTVLQDNFNRTLERCQPTTTALDLKSLHSLHGYGGAAGPGHQRRGRRWLARRDGSILHNLKAIKFVGGGGGGGGGTFVFLVSFPIYD